MILSFIESLKVDLNYTNEYNQLFYEIEKASDLSKILHNKDSSVKKMITLSPQKIYGDYHIDDLVQKGILFKKATKEIIVLEPFATEGTITGYGIIIEGPIFIDKNVVIRKSSIFGPGYISEKTKIHDSVIRGGKRGSVFIGKNCSIWDFTVIIRSWIGENSLIHTCNIDDSIVGPNCNFGATNITFNDIDGVIPKSNKKNMHRLGQRIVICNYAQGKIRVFDPISEELHAIGDNHFGAVVGSNTWIGAGAIVYPGTIIGNQARINCSIPVTGYIRPKSDCSIFLSIKGKDQKLKCSITESSAV